MSQPLVSKFLVELFYLDHRQTAPSKPSRQLWKAKAKPCDEKDRMRPWGHLGGEEWQLQGDNWRKEYFF